MTRPSSCRVLGIDPGTRVVGYGLIDVYPRMRIQHLECGELNVKREPELQTRLHRLAEEVVEIIAEFRPHQMAIEHAFHGVNANSALKLAEARGALKLVALQNKLVVSEYSPATIKKSVTGNGRATKAEVQARIRLICQLNRLPSPDAADALAVALCHAQTILRLTQRESI